MLCEGSAGCGNVHFVYKLHEYFQPKDAMLYRSLEELGDIVREFAVSRVVEPTQLRDTAHEFDEGSHHEIHQSRTLRGEVAQDVVPDLDALRNGEAVPIVRDELCETIRCHQPRVHGRRVVENVLALGYVIHRGLKAQQP